MLRCIFKLVLLVVGDKQAAALPNFFLPLVDSKRYYDYFFCSQKGFCRCFFVSSLQCWLATFLPMLFLPGSLFVPLSKLIGNEKQFHPRKPGDLCIEVLIDIQRNQTVFPPWNQKNKKLQSVGLFGFSELNW